MLRKLVAIGAFLALTAVPAASAGPNLRIGAVEDVAIWSSNPAAEMNLAKTTGFDTIRMTAQWSTGMTKLPGLQMGRIQQAAMAANARGIQPILAIYNQASSSTPADPTSRQQFVQFAVDAVRQLPWISTFIVGNEPNYSYYWAPQAGAAAAYEQLLAATYDAIKAVRPSATVVGGALDPHASHAPGAFIQDLGAAYRASGRTTPIMDVFDLHIYPDNSTLPPSMVHAGPALGAGDYPKLVSLLGKAFDGTAQKGSTLPILYGEFGIESAIPAGTPGYSGTETAKTVDESTQGAYWVQAVKLAVCQPNVIGILNFHVSDESSLAGWQSGPFYSDGSPKASFPAFHDAIAYAHAGTLTSCPDQTAPTVTLQVGNGVVTAGATDDVGVGAVQLLVDGKQADVDYTAPYSFPWKPTQGGAVLQVRAVDAAGNVGVATTVVGVRMLSGTRGKLVAGPGGTFTWKAPKSGDVTFRAARSLQVYAGPRRIVGKQVRFTAKRGVTYKLSVRSLPLSWKS